MPLAVALGVQDRYIWGQTPGRNPLSRLRRLTLPTILCAAFWAAGAPASLAQQGAAGALLAAREAAAHSDFAASLPYLERLHQIDPQNPATLEALVLGAMSVGDTATASRHAAALTALDPNNPAAVLVLIAQGFVAQDHAAVLDLAATTAPVHPLVTGLARAWAHLGDGRMSDAQSALDDVARIDGMRAFAVYCRALALALVGDVEGAVALIEDPADNVAAALNRRGYVAYALLLGQTERFDDALALIDEVFAGSLDPALDRMRAAYQARQALPFDLIDSPAKGMAEVFAVMASAMQSADNLGEALIYAQAAVWVNPGLSDAQLMIGRIFEAMGHPEAAAAAYAAIPVDDVFGMAARMGRAQVLETLGQREEAIAVLSALATTSPHSFAAQSVLGDFLRRDGQFAAADTAYTRALDLLDSTGRPAEWQTLFARAIARSRLGDWPAAEADFRAALAIEPNQSSVLNYLGYSLVERGENLDEALSMIERAVAGDPTSGYILDSLAWALFRTGRHIEALPHMERAVELAPTDAILNDHLGDVYWAVGRQREARFQWRRALSFAPADDLDEARIRRKLEVGLDVVRAEAGEPPLTP